MRRNQPHSSSSAPSSNYLSLPSISIQASVEEIAKCMEEDSQDGVLLLTDLPPAPFMAIQQLLQDSPDVTTRLNQAAVQANPQNPDLVLYKGVAYGSGSSNIDRKCSLDLSLERLDTIAKVDPQLIQETTLQGPLKFYKSYQSMVQEKIIPALARVIGIDDQALADDMAYSYRMIDYYPPQQQQKSSSSSTSSSTKQRPRLAEHRDFGFLTLIQASHPGLQAKIGNDTKWKNLPATPPGTALLMGGWCARIRSNNRLPAILHRVPSHFDDTSSGAAAATVGGGGGIRRVSAVLFCNPHRVDVCLDPIVREGEPRHFHPKKHQGGAITAAALQEQLVKSKKETAVHQWLGWDPTAAATTTTRRKNKKNNKTPRPFLDRLFFRAGRGGSLQQEQQSQ